MLKTLKQKTLAVMLLPLLYIVTAFVPILNPVMHSVNNSSPNTSFIALIYNMDGLVAPINQIEGAKFVSFFMPLATICFLLVYGLGVLGCIFGAVGNSKTCVKIANLTAVFGIVFSVAELILFVYSAAKTTATISFPLGSVVILVISVLTMYIKVLYKKQYDLEDTRARYLKTIFTKTQKREAITFYGMVLPFYLMACIVTMYPFLWGITISFTNFTGYNLNVLEGTGFSSYMRCIQDEQTWTSFVTTLEIGIFYVPICLVMGVALAMLLNTNIKGAGFFRTVYYFPSIIPGIATGLMWRMLFAQNGGAINTMLGWFGVSAYNWLGYSGCRYSLYIMLAWGAAGGILTYLSALKSISNELYESAMIDGASGWKRFWSITIPMISSTLFYNLVTGLIAAWQIYQQPVFLAGATLLTVPYQPNYTFVVQIYQQIFTNMRFGFGLAMVWILFGASMITNRIVFWTGSLWVFNENAAQKEKKVKKQKAIVSGN